MPRTTKRARRGRGEASIYFRESDSRWVGSISLGYDDAGKRRRRTVYGNTKDEVAKEIRKLQTSNDEGGLADVDDMTVGEYLNQWISIVKSSVRAATHVRYAQLVDQFILPSLGRVRLSKLNGLHIEAMFARMTKEVDGQSVEVSASTKKAAGVVLGIALRSAVKKRIIKFNPAAGVERPKPEFKEISFLTPSQSKRFLEASEGSTNATLYKFALGTGCRQGEMLALGWNDLDLEAATAKISRSLSQLHGREFIVKEPKSKSSKRTISLPKFVLDALKEHRKAMLKAGLISAPVFCTANGTYIGKSNLNRQFKGIVRAANTKAQEEEPGTTPLPPGLRFHDLRHTHASCLIASGQSVKAVSRRLGHKDVTITLKVYSHVMPDDDAKLATATGELFAVG